MRCEATHNAEAASEAVRVSSWSNRVLSDGQMNLFLSRVKSLISSGSIEKCDDACYRSNWSHYASSWRLNELINFCIVGAIR